MRSGKNGRNREGKSDLYRLNILFLLAQFRMARKDLYHDYLRYALEQDGWIITDDPLDLSIGEVELLADLGAERVLAAEKGSEKIAIEVKSFVGQSPVSEFHKALGQY